MVQATHAQTITPSGDIPQWNGSSPIPNPWLVGGDLLVGASGTGTLTVEAGGSVSNGTGVIGQSPGSEGTVMVMGVGSSWDNSGNLNVGGFGTGTLTLKAGGSVSNAIGYIGLLIGSEGTVTVTGAGSMWENRAGLSVGRFGTGSLRVEAGGRVSNANGIIGQNSGSEGTVTVTGAGSSWDNRGTLYVGYNAAGTLTVEDDGSVSATNVILALNTGSSGTLVVGSAVGEAVSAAGTLSAATVSFRNGTADLVFNHTDTDYTFSSTLDSSGTGTHRITVLSGTTKLTADNSGFSGTTVVDGGKLIVNGALSGALDINAGGWLGGSGTVGSGTGSLVSVLSGGTVAPGNSIGTLTVEGDFILAPGATYEAEIASNGISDLINVVGGTATVTDATVTPVALDLETNYRDGQTYRILSASNGVSGTFSTINTTSAFLDYSLAYDANNVDLKVQVKAVTPPVTPPGPPVTPPVTPPGPPVTPPFVFRSVTETLNQYATAGALDSLSDSGSSLALYNRLLMLDADQARSAFDNLSGEIHASTQTALIEDSRHVREAINARLRSAFDAAGSSSSPVIAYGPSGYPVSVSADDPGGVLWSHGFGSWGSHDNNGNAAATDRRTAGVLFGMDADIADWRFGLVGGYSRSAIDADDRRSSADSDNWHVGLYGGTQWNALAFRGGASYTWSDIDTSRNISIPGLTETEKTGYDAALFQAFGELAYGLDVGGSRLEPFANLSYVSLHRDGFEEHGGIATLSGHSDTQNVTFTTIGLRAEHQVDIGNEKLMLSGMLGWRHAFGDRTARSVHAFETGNAFTIEGVPIAQNSAAIDFGVDMQVSQQATVGVSYSGQWSSRARDNTIKVQIKAKF
ncbi:autotransporter domain-containing protein [Brucellaceae bacterium D45D]